MEKPIIIDPPIPYVGLIRGGTFGPEKVVRIQGTVPGVAYRFDINLQCGPQMAPRSDVAMQVSVRMLDGFISLNSLQDGIWDTEQRGTLPIRRADHFEIIIICDFNRYKIAINGQYYGEFPQRVHYDRITHLSIDGDVSIIQISYESNTGTNAGSTSSVMPMPLPTVQDENDEFDMIDANGSRSRLNASAPSANYSQPPPYSAVISGNYGAKPYYNPTNSGIMNYPAGVTNMAPYPTGAPPIGISPYPASRVPIVPPPPLNAPIPLNAASSNFRSVERRFPKKIVAGIGSVLIVFALITIAIIMYLQRQGSRPPSYIYNDN